MTYNSRLISEHKKAVRAGYDDTAVIPVDLKLIQDETKKFVSDMRNDGTTRLSAGSARGGMTFRWHM